MRLAAAACAALAATVLAADPPRSSPLMAGVEFQSTDVRALQADAFANPGLLWVERGAALWSAARGERAIACAACHGDPTRSMRGVSARYPAYAASLGQVVDLERRINACVTENQRGAPLAMESQEMLALSALVARQSRDMPIAVEIDARSAETYERGRQIYFRRQGQLNLACTQCHDASWGKTLLAERISQGHPADWPAYRLEWQSIGSLGRRLRACYFGVRAEMPAYGSSDMVALELYLARRASGLVSDAPGVRR